MAEHTQGRWHVKRGRGIGCSYAILVGTDDANVACVRDIRRFNPDGNFPPDAWNEVEANARLIAAAPDMLTALRAAGEALHHDVPGSCWATGPLTGDPVEDLVVCPGCRALHSIRAAIAKATGSAA